ncbi:hypothetical protein BJ170DRAFT_590885 [Xylariales sp. AK1849]|nr:hypothetical protein BJ170DRAFT_590885 [Xylariales sp. AK1849]
MVPNHQRHVSDVSANGGGLGQQRANSGTLSSTPNPRAPSFSSRTNLEGDQNPTGFPHGSLPQFETAGSNIGGGKTSRSGPRTSIPPSTSRGSFLSAPSSGCSKLPKPGSQDSLPKSNSQGSPYNRKDPCAEAFPDPAVISLTSPPICLTAASGILIPPAVYPRPAQQTAVPDIGAQRQPSLETSQTRPLWRTMISSYSSRPYGGPKLISDPTIGTHGRDRADDTPDVSLARK